MLLIPRDIDNSMFDISHNWIENFDYNHSFTLGGGSSGGSRWNNKDKDIGIYYDWDSGRYRNAKTGKFVSNNLVKYLLPQIVDKTWKCGVYNLGEGNPFLIVYTKLEKAYLEEYQINIQIYGSNYKEYNWVQTVNLWDKKTGWDDLGFKIDPSDVNHGFFYNKEIYVLERKWYQSTDSDGYFYDAPNLLQFRAQLTLVGKDNNGWHSIQSMSWGYSTIDRNDYFELIDLPLKSHQDWVNSAINYWNNR